MSAEATSWAWAVADQLDNHGQLCILLALAEHAAPTGECFPRRKTIAEMCAYASPGPVTKAINRMVDLGLVEKEPRYQTKKEGGKVWQTSNEYRLKLEVPGRKLTGAVARPGVPQDPTPPVPGQEALVLPGTPPPVSPGAPQEPSEKEPTKEPDTPPVSEFEHARKVYDHWVAVFQPQRPPAFTQGVSKQIAKGLALYSADDLCLAFDGLAEWRKRKPGKTNLGAVLDTYPGGKPLHEQIAFFISQAKGATPGGGKYPSAPKAIVAEHQRWVQRGHRLFDNAEAVKRARESEVWLFERGIVCQAGVSPNEGQPSFRARRDGDVFQALSISGARS